MMQLGGLASKWSGAGRRTGVHQGNTNSYELVTVETEWLIREGLWSLALYFHVCVEFSPVRSFKNFHGVTGAGEEIHCHSFPDQQLRPGVQGTGVQDKGPAWREVAPGPGCSNPGPCAGAGGPVKRTRMPRGRVTGGHLAQSWVCSAKCPLGPER